MKYLKLFDLDADYQAFIGGEFITPNVSYTLDTNITYYNPGAIVPSEPDYSKEYLTFTALEDDMTVSFAKKASSGTLNYSIDEGNTWTELTDTTLSINTGEKIMFKGDLIPVSSSGIGTYSTTKNFDVSGNIMSLLYGDDFVGQTDLTGKNYAFYTLFGTFFGEHVKVVNAKDLILPATTLANYCYYGMFYNCSSLTTAPELPATTLTSDCYGSMFSHCRTLTTAPELPATTLANYCYGYMFEDCIKLTTAPELPATTLAQSCYRGMFNVCISLKYIKMLATNTSAKDCLYIWVDGVASTGTFVKSAGVNIPSGRNGIPSGWTVEEVEEV